MSLKAQSLGTVGAAALGIVFSGGTNATPIVATVTAGHRLKNGDRVGVVGVTTLTAMNGDWTVGAVGATAATLLGSAGNGAYAGTAVVAALMDRSPFMAGHSAVVLIGQPSGAVLVGTLVIEGADQRKADNSAFQHNHPTTDVLTDGFVSALKSGEIAIPAATAGQGMAVEVDLMRYMTIRASAFTSGAASATILA